MLSEEDIHVDVVLDVECMRPSRRYVRRRYTRKPKAEVKTYVSALTTFSHDLGVEPDDPAITVVNPGFNTMANGTTNITRVGNVVARVPFRFDMQQI